MSHPTRLNIKAICDGYIQGKSSSDLAEEHGANYSTILYWLKKSGVKTRSIGEANRLAGKNGKCIGKNWKGGRLYNERGYILILLRKDDFFYPMVNKHGYVLEHRLVVAKALGRCLQPWEIVHHKHARYPAGSVEDKRDNRYPENLQLVTDDRHKQITILENRIRWLEKRVLRLEAENVLLSSEKYKVRS